MACEEARDKPSRYKVVGGGLTVIPAHAGIHLACERAPRRHEREWHRAGW